MATKDIDFVAVHAGAGYYSNRDQKGIVKLCKKACSIGARQLTSGKPAIDSCVAATVVLEDSPLTNAGFGSNLNLEEKVECDAGLMDSSGMEFAGVGAVRSVKNPIRVAKHLLDERRKSHVANLVRPFVLVGDGAEKFAQRIGAHIVEPKTMISSRSRRVFKRVLSHVETIQTSKLLPMDTVGSISVDNCQLAAASCSSGGLLLKEPGRVGHATMFGAGCWAEVRNGNICAVSCSGCGEYLIKTHTAQIVADALFEAPDSGFKHEVLQNTLKEKYLNSVLLCNSPKEHKLIGCICVFYSCSLNLLEFIWAHNSAVFPVCFWSKGVARTKQVLSRNEDLADVKAGCICAQ
ncbi:Asparaginase 2 domain containing protein [Trichuris trichiura]|uniref:Asparaginase 2 domain containing protein n=1 Tax=Trichuris trichiura TaxID=36087 RepID=A0A077ZE59_TRITR|nr:Asparaginase 2 domain containing protein [Trichuris trichiura]